MNSVQPDRDPPHCIKLDDCICVRLHKCMYIRVESIVGTRAPDYLSQPDFVGVYFIFSAVSLFHTKMFTSVFRVDVSVEKGDV